MSRMRDRDTRSMGGSLVEGFKDSRIQGVEDPSEEALKPLSSF